jgi:hypothetical protein
VAERLSDFREADEALPHRQVAALACDDVGDGHQCSGQHQSRHHASDEQPPDRDVGKVTVDDQPDRRRNERCDDRRARRDHRGEGRAVVRLHHLRAEYLGQHRCIGVEDAVRPPSSVASTVHICASAPVICPTIASGQGEQMPRDAGLVHDRAGEHEERQRKQGVGIGGGHHLLDEDVERHLAVDQKERQGADGDRKAIGTSSANRTTSRIAGVQSPTLVSRCGSIARRARVAPAGSERSSGRSRTRWVRTETRVAAAGQGLDWTTRRWRSVCRTTS